MRAVSFNICTAIRIVELLIAAADPMRQLNILPYIAVEAVLEHRHRAHLDRHDQPVVTGTYEQRLEGTRKIRHDIPSAY